MASGLNTQKRFLVRLSLVTGSTLATIIGAQGLLALDGQIATAQAQVTTVTASDPVLNTNQAQTAADQAATSQNSSTQTATGQAAPGFVVIRRNGEVDSIQNGQVQVIRPPQPSELAAPAPQIIQSAPQQSFQTSQPQQQTFGFPFSFTRSSR
jgi:hypothetical protein